MSDAKWLLKQGFDTCEETSSGFSLLVKKINPNADNPKFKDSVKSGECDNKSGLVAYYSNRCPFSEFHVTTSLTETAKKRNLPLEIVKLDTLDKAQSAPTPATIFSLYYNGKFITTDLSSCLDKRFEKLFEKIK